MDESVDLWKCRNVMVSGDHSWRLEIGTLGDDCIRFRLLGSAGAEDFFPGGPQPTRDEVRNWITSHVPDPYGDSMARRLCQAPERLGWFSPD